MIVMSKTKKIPLIMGIMAAVCLLGLPHSEAGRGNANSITIKGSTTVLPLAQRAAEEFMKKNPQADISVQGGGSSVGIAAIIDKTCDIGDASRAIKESELEQAARKGSNPKANVVAMDGIAIIVNAANPISALSQSQVKDIYTGKISDWSKVGGSGGKIVAVSRDTSSGTYEAFNELALHKAKVRSDAVLQASNQAVASVVAKTPGAIGYVGLAYMKGDNIKSVLYEGVEASKETVLRGQYKLSRPLFMYTNGKPSGIVKAFIDFVLSKEGQQIADEEGYVGLM